MKRVSIVFNTGLGLFTLMDGAIDSVALVNLLGTSDFYNPLKGAPEQVKFVNLESKKESRLFGQVSEVRCKKFNAFYS